MNSKATHGAISWIEHTGPDAAKARAFYVEVLGWEMTEVPMPEGAYPIILMGETPVGGFSPKPNAPGWNVYITVDDVDARVARARAAGATIATEPHDVPGVGRMAAVTDPQGATIHVIRYETP